MKTFKDQAAQGDCFFRRVDQIPPDAEEITKWDGVVTHSETGHHHLFRAVDGIKFFRTQDPLVCYLRMESDAVLEHAREFDTHAPIMFSAGCFQVRRQREYVPEGWRQVVD